MQQLGQGADSAKTVAELPMLVLPITGRLLGMILLVSPLLLAFGLFAYNILEIGLPYGLAWQQMLTYLVIFLFTIQLCTGAISIIQITLSLFNTRRNTFCNRLSSRFELIDSPKVQPISLIVWSHNQSDWLGETLKSLLAINYPDYEVIIINDGSDDATLEILELEFGLQPLNRVYRRALSTGAISAIYTSSQYPILTVIDKPYTGRADSLNIGLNLARAPLVCFLEPSHLLSRNALMLLAKPFIEEPQTTLVTASTGEPEMGVNHMPITFLENLQQIERKRLFHSSLLVRSAFCLISTTNSAVRLLRKQDLIQLGGFQGSKTDNELWLNLQLVQARCKQARPYRVRFVPDILCWTRLITTRESLAAMHRRWQMILLQTVIGNIKMLVQQGLGWRRIALIVLLLEIVAPVLELMGLITIPLALLVGAITGEIAALYFFTIVIFALLKSLGGIIADEISLRRQHSFPEIIGLLLVSLVEGLSYRFLTAFWRIHGAIIFII
ncbi:MAG: glycosyltransferase [Acidobacteriota bacterium]